MAETDLKIKDAPLSTNITGNAKMAGSDGSGRPVAISLSQVYNFVNSGLKGEAYFAAKTDIPTKVSSLINDSGFITSTALAPYLKKTELPTKVSAFTNDAGYLVKNDLAPYALASSLPTKVSQLENDSKFATVSQIPTKVSELQNDSGYLSEETDPTVPSWAKQPNKPTYTASEVGALSEIPQATDTVLGGVKLGYEENGKNYPIRTDETGKAYVNVPWSESGAGYVHPKFTPHDAGLYKITVNDEGHVSDATAVTKDDITALGIPSQDTTYSAGSGLSLSGTTINHASSITAGTAGSISSTSGSNTISIPYVTYNNTGHVTAAGTHTHTINAATTSASGLMSSADKTKMNRLESYTTATRVASLNVNYQTIYVTLSENASLSASGTGTAYNGKTITAYVYTSSSVTITIPTSGNYVSMCGSSFTTTADGWVEFSLVCVNGVWHIAKLEAE